MTSMHEHIEHAFELFTPGSQGFITYVETHCDGMGMSRGEIERISNVAPNSSAFTNIWNDQDWWTDDRNA